MAFVTRLLAAGHTVSQAIELHAGMDDDTTGIAVPATQTVGAVLDAVYSVLAGCAGTLVASAGDVDVYLCGNGDGIAWQPMLHVDDGPLAPIIANVLRND
jgi:hypothetical protein